MLNSYASDSVGIIARHDEELVMAAASLDEEDRINGDRGDIIVDPKICAGAPQENAKHWTAGIRQRLA